MKAIIFLFFVVIVFDVPAQDTLYSDIDANSLRAKELAGYRNLKAGKGLNRLNFVVTTFLNVYSDNKNTVEARESTRGKTEVLMKNYESYQSYPESITDGWHNTIVTDHHNFCEYVKVLVDQNKITELVVDGCIRVDFIAPGQIRHGKSLVTIRDFNGKDMDMMEVYFIFDMDKPELIPEPMPAGCVCFWSNKWNYMNENIIMDGVTYEGITKLIKSVPGNCFEDGAVTMILKPGVYSFEAQKKGNDKIRSFEVKSGKCLKYRLP